jgi:hypothetical protein
MQNIRRSELPESVLWDLDCVCTSKGWLKLKGFTWIHGNYEVKPLKAIVIVFG